MDKALPEALAAAARGWFVFPITANEKAPPLIKNNLQDASSDPEQIKAWSKEWPGCNWGVSCGKSNLAVIDVDDGNGKNGFATLAGLEKSYGQIPMDWIVDTPSGGAHLYTTGRCKSGTEILGPGIDVKSDGGYVVLPGSHTSAGVYKWSRREGEIPKTPAGILERMDQPLAREPSTPLADPDEPDAVGMAIRYAKEAPPATQGEHGDDHTFRVACRMRDYGVLEETCFDLLLEHFNPRCNPPWEPEDLRRKVENAYQYAKKPQGNSAPSVIKEEFFEIPEEEIPKTKKSAAIICAGDLDFSTIPKRDWVMGRRYMSDFMSLLISPGGMGKSMLSIADALAIASGRPLTGETVHKKGPVWIYNTEDPLDEIKRRVAAAAVHFELSKEDLQNVFISSGRDRPIILVQNNDDRVPVFNMPNIKWLINELNARQCVHMLIDPFVKCHAVNENDNMAIDKVAQALQLVCSRTKVSMCVVHHTSKSGSKTAGDQNASRGASSLVAAARIAHTLTNIPIEEGKRLKIAEDKVKWFVRLDDAKANMSPPDAGIRYFERVSVELPSGDNVGVMAPYTKVTEDVAKVFENINLVDAVFEAWKGEPVTVGEMAKNLRENHKDGRSRTAIERDIKKQFETGQEQDGLRLTIGQVQKGKTLYVGLVESEIDDDFEF